MNIKFYLSSTFLLTAGFFSGFILGRDLGYNFLVKLFGDPKGEALLTFFVFGSALAIFGSFLGLLTSLIIIHRLGRKWGAKLSFGSHPALKITGLSFLTFLGILVALLFLIPTK